MTTPPEWLASASSNVMAKVFRGGVADLRPVPRALIDRGPHRSVYRFAPTSRWLGGEPVLLVPPLAAPALCFDLRRGCSLAEHLLDGGRRTYLVDYGTVSFSDRSLGVEHWIDEVLPRAIAAVSKDSGGQRVHVVSWCLGGIFSLLTTADKPDLPIASITTVAVPIDFTAISLFAPMRPLVNVAGGRVFGAAVRLMGGAPRALVKRAFQVSAIDKYVTKPIAILQHLDDREFLAQIEAVDHFTDNMIAYPGRTFGQLYHRFFRSNDLAEGEVDLSGRRVSLAKVKPPVLVIAGEGDGIAPKRAVRKLVDVLENSAEVRWKTAPGGHLGVLTGRGARATTWTYIDEFLDAHAT
ncbi:polyhydroxyalkanoate synthase [Herbihabitans rhizosphaerae]|uniref:Polyhydroxyalkanoate synthase n=1 Tax=Herbihabitans rhizosphaerae TaxID=1872711 RepID=A0A4Q7KKX5_9PSEU|nr:alpha/beta fold hydrolase [Herbihabitans rhizosphaerae]RZS36540.1 polyhydroxyalkanoate synthase [Herbihabitans rhizosphaerae]